MSVSAYVPGAILLSVWALVHSLTISEWFKNLVRRRVGGGIVHYRLAYNLFSLATFGLVWLLLPGGGEPLWALGGLAAGIFLVIQGLGVLFFLWTLRYFDVRSFLGLDGFCGCADGSEPKDEAAPCRARLTRAGPFAVCRHPMYLAGIVILGFQPVMTPSRWLLFLWAVAYFYLGSLHEERRLVGEFGDEYRDYRRGVSRILPLSWLRERFGRR